MIINRHNRMQYSQRGFTLIELLLYFALAGVMIAVLGSIGLNVLGSRVKVHAQEDIRYEAVQVMEEIRMLIETADDISIQAGPATTTMLSLSMSDPLFDPTTIFLQQRTQEWQSDEDRMVYPSYTSYSNKDHRQCAK